MIGRSVGGTVVPGVRGVRLSAVAQAAQEVVNEWPLRIDGSDLLIDGFPIMLN